MYETFCMPIALKKFLKRLEAERCVYRVDQSGHYRVYRDNEFLFAFAVTHGKRTKGNEVKDVYVHRFERLIRKLPHE